MKILKVILFILIPLCLTQCQGQNNKKDLEMKDTNALESFKKQKHRFEFRENLLFYNDQQVKINQPLSYYKEIFGNNYETYKYGNLISYHNVPILLAIKNGSDNIVGSIRLFIYYPDEQTMRKTVKFQSTFWLTILDEENLLVDGIPINKNSYIENVNEKLEANNKTPFSIKMGGHLIERQYYDPDKLELTHNISFSRGELSPLSYMIYSYSGD